MGTFQMQVETDHGVLFFADPGSHITIPPETGASCVTSTSDCIAFWVLHYVDGASLVTISDEPCTVSGVLRFDGLIETGETITLMDSSTFPYINVPVPAGQTSVRI